MRQPIIGIDIIEIDRIQEAISRWEDHFLRRIFTAPELELCRGRVESLAARFAGKEAVMKALSAPGVTISWLEIEILSEPDGKPRVQLYGQALRQQHELGLSVLGISLSHSRENAIALVIGIRDTLT